MFNELLLGIDIGTSACKVAAFRRDGTAVFECTEEYDVFYPSPGWAEQDAEDWWGAVCRATQRMLSSGEVRREEINGVGVAGQSWAALPVDREGKALRRAMIWLDTRSAQQCENVLKIFDSDEQFRQSGNPLSPGYTTGKILWVRDHEPEIYRQTYCFLQSNSYIVMKLTGAFTHDVSQGNGIHVFNVSDCRWEDSACEKLGIDRAKLAPLYACSEVVGSLTARAAAQTGLPVGIPVVAGGLDAACATLGAGVLQPGQTQEQGGQAGGMSIAMDRPLMDQRLILGCHVVPGRWLLQGGTVGGGGCLNWLRKELFKGYAEESGEFYARMSAEASRSEPGSGGLLFLPYMAGERSPIWDPHAKGTWFGITFDKSRGQLVRSIMEGVAYSLLHNLKTAEESGADVGELFSVGGAAKSKIWTQIKADVTGKTFRIPSSDQATTLGAALLAGVGVGMYRDFEEAVSAAVTYSATYAPNPNNRELYHKMYGLYLETHRRLKDLYSELRG